MKIKTLYNQYEESFEAFDERVNQYIERILTSDTAEIISVTPLVTNSVEGVDYFITIVFKS
ncbi:hypothetical protein OXR01_06435 [Staphylococcus gallinarum]|uniref:Uncharacterized protein n=1 Tax=Staphylococcus gallinarum TaxID=1293 RepID=A0A0D0SNJ5_STAGA|nr:hypothetical protein [Staphylococcus gallinarum]KIR10709.1 hypothetical protein SH09_11135 [Staphylococcus gallinarum]MBU7218602.1 hypothetical protein [Staphylococcus gallinarum]MCD8786535.1 hypothetical protein [Staphylococcus gallinarum]MCD8794337.1 hypothetical protein [Staphylococcus gallinarum]MCD8821153.1 hypothetical protein [Staphylococcus gallinarum]